MIRSFNHSSYPRVGESPLDQQIRTALRGREDGRVTNEELRDVADAVTTIVIAEQSRAFIDIVTDGMVRWAGPLSHLAVGLEGLELGGLRRWFDTNFYDRRITVTGAIRRPNAFTLHDYRIAAGVAQKPVKVVLPGPAIVARLARDEYYGDPDKLADALAAALAEEIAELAAAGVTCFQLDEPLLCRHPEDLERVARTATRIFAAAPDAAVTAVSTYYGDIGVLGDRLGELPGTHLSLDLTAGGCDADLLTKLPDGRGVMLGLFDARTTVQEDADDVAGRLEPYRELLTSRDVLVGPNAGLELLPRDIAFDKLLHSRYLVEKLTKEWTWA